MISRESEAKVEFIRMDSYKYTSIA